MIVKLVMTCHEDRIISRSRLRLAFFFFKQSIAVVFKKRRFVAKKNKRLLSVSGNVLVGPWGVEVYADTPRLDNEYSNAPSPW